MVFVWEEYVIAFKDIMVLIAHKQLALLEIFMIQWLVHAYQFVQVDTIKINMIFHVKNVM